MAARKAEAKPSRGNESIGGGLAGVQYLVGLQLIARLCTFGFNQILLRRISTRVFGAASLQLELFASTSLFLSREAFRQTLLRGRTEGTGSPNGGKVKTEDGRLVDFASWIPALGVICTGLISAIYLRNLAENTKSLPYFSIAVILYACATVLELCSEPHFLVLQKYGRQRERAWVEGCAYLGRCVVTLVLAIMLSHRRSEEDTILAFAAGQLIYASSLVLGFRHFAKDHTVALWPRTSALTFRENESTRGLLCANLAQAGIKHILTEGDRFAVSRFSALENQGVYALVSNYGSLVTRIFFQPVEEISRLAFGEWMGPKDPTREGLARSRELFSALLHVHVLLALPLVCIAPHYTSLVITLLAGHRWAGSTAPALLRAYCLYVPLMGINGITEGFLSTTADKRALAQLNLAMFGFSAAFILSSYSLIHVAILPEFWGGQDAAYIAGNGISLVLRILYALIYTRRRFTDRSLMQWRQAILPHPMTLLSALVGAALCTSSDVDRHAKVAVVISRDHLARGILASALYLGAASVYEGEKVAVLRRALVRP